MAEVVIDITLSIESPLSIGAGGSAGILANKTIVRNRRSQLVLPGSHLKGRLRHACELIARSAGLAICDSPRPESMCPNLQAVQAPCPICQIFGSPAYAGALHFSDLVYAEPVLQPAIRPGNSVNRRRRVVEEQRLYFVETSPPGELVHFHSATAIYGELPAAQAEAQSKLLLAGLRFLQNWGGGKSRGLGWGTIDCQAAVDGRRVELIDLESSIRGLQ